jgi:hypothetical protein
MAPIIVSSSCYRDGIPRTARSASVSLNFGTTEVAAVKIHTVLECNPSDSAKMNDKNSTSEYEFTELFGSEKSSYRTKSKTSLGSESDASQSKHCTPTEGPIQSQSKLDMPYHQNFAQSSPTESYNETQEAVEPKGTESTIAFGGSDHMIKEGDKTIANLTGYKGLIGGEQSFEEMVRQTILRNKGQTPEWAKSRQAQISAKVQAKGGVKSAPPASSGPSRDSGGTFYSNNKHVSSYPHRFSEI